MGILAEFVGLVDIEDFEEELIQRKVSTSCIIGTEMSKSLSGPSHSSTTIVSKTQKSHYRGSWSACRLSKYMQGRFAYHIIGNLDKFKKTTTQLIQAGEKAKAVKAEGTGRTFPRQQ